MYKKGAKKHDKRPYHDICDDDHDDDIIEDNNNNDYGAEDDDDGNDHDHSGCVKNNMMVFSVRPA